VHRSGSAHDSGVAELPFEAHSRQEPLICAIGRPSWLVVLMVTRRVQCGKAFGVPVRVAELGEARAVTLRAPRGHAACATRNSYAGLGWRGCNGAVRRTSLPSVGQHEPRARFFVAQSNQHGRACRAGASEAQWLLGRQLHWVMVQKPSPAAVPGACVPQPTAEQVNSQLRPEMQPPVLTAHMAMTLSPTA